MLLSMTWEHFKLYLKLNKVKIALYKKELLKRSIFFNSDLTEGLINIQNLVTKTFSLYFYRAVMPMLYRKLNIAIKFRASVVTLCIYILKIVL